MASETLNAEYVVVGGGIAGISCAQELSSNAEIGEQIIVISASSLVKTTVNLQQIGRSVDCFDVEEGPSDFVFNKYKNVKIVTAVVVFFDYNNKCLLLNTGMKVTFGKLCICTGAIPKSQFVSEYLLTIRDTENVIELRKKMQNARRILIVGNGGIATELVYQVENVDIIWAIKHSTISATFFDAGAGIFFLEHIKSGKKRPKESIVKRELYTLSNCEKVKDANWQLGSALGPDWIDNCFISGFLEVQNLHIVYNVELAQILSPNDLRDQNLQLTAIPENLTTNNTENWPVFAKLTNGEIFGFDLIISAIGVTPNVEIWTRNNPNLQTGDNGGLKVDDQMETSLKDVYAAGDVCTVDWNDCGHWHQWRLWTQARQMGSFAGRTLCRANVESDMCFQLFSHVTRFFGFKVVLLGRFNGQGLCLNDTHVLVRVLNGQEYVKVVVRDGKVQGAVLIGDTDLEETFENLILNSIDIAALEEGLLDSSVDLDSYFD